jgi:hypothetical protein
MVVVTPNRQGRVSPDKVYNLARIWAVGDEIPADDEGIVGFSIEHGL